MKENKETMAVAAHFLPKDQFLGFAGSLEPFQLTFFVDQQTNSESRAGLTDNTHHVRIFHSFIFRIFLNTMSPFTTPIASYSFLFVSDRRVSPWIGQHCRIICAGTR
jgi:hypothetical protein